LIRRATISNHRSSDDLCLRALIKEGDLSPVVDASYSLDEIVDAHRYVDQGHKKGNVVITIEGKRP
jgi:NADPH:quinone reductase-like Zn-dependent oxidoreductase